MTRRDTYDGSDAPFQGNVVLRLRSIPVNARITKATATIRPGKGGPEAFTEVITIANHTGDFGTTEADTADWVEVDFHTRRTLAAVAGSSLTGSSVQVDVGGGTYVDISKTGGFLTPSGPPALALASDSEALPSLTVAKLKLTNSGKNPALTQVTIRSVPSNLSLRIGDLAPFWTHTGEMPLPETTPDFAPLLQNFLANAKVDNGSYLVPLTVHSDNLARLSIVVEIEQASQATAIPSGLKEVVQPFDFSSLPQPQADVLKVEVPANARVVSELTAAKVKGGFDPTRVVLGPTGPVSPGAVVEVSPSATLAQPFTITKATAITGIDLLIACSDPTISLQADIRADLSGKPDNTPLFRGPVDLSLEKKSAGESPSFWASVKLPAQFHLDAAAAAGSVVTPKTYWLVLQSLNGTATWSAVSADHGAKVAMQRSQDGGFSWRLATPQPQASGPHAISGPLAALFRLRRQPDQYQVPIDLLVGTPPTAARIKLDRFAPLGRVDFAPTAELTDGFNQYFQNVAAQSPHACPQGEQLANGDFEQWSVVADNSGKLHPVDFGPVLVNGTSVAVAPDGRLAYVGITRDGVPHVQVIDILCDRLATGSEIDLQNFGDPFLAIAPNGSRLYAAVNQHDGSDKIHVVDISGDTPAEIGASVDTTTFTKGLSPVAIAVSPDGNRLYFVGQSKTTAPPSALLAFRTASLEQAVHGVAKLQAPDTTQITSGQPSGLAISADGSRLYLAVAGASQGQIWVFDANAIGTGALQTINVACQPKAIALTPDGTHAIVVGQTSSATSPGAVCIIDLASQVSINVAIDSAPIAVVVSPDGQRAFVAGAATSSGHLAPGATATLTGSIAVVDLSRARAVQTLSLDGVPAALAINPQGDRVFVAKSTSRGTATSTPIDVISFGTRVPAEWMLTAGSVTPYCLNGDAQIVALLGHVPAATEPAPPANGLSQVVPAAACTYDFSFWGLSDQDGSVGEVLWLDQTGQLLRADQLPIQVWAQPSAPAGSFQILTPAPTPSPTPTPASDPDLLFEKALSGPQPPLLHRSRLLAPAGTAQAEVRFTVPSGGLAAVSMVSLAGAAAAVDNSDLQILQNGIPQGWTLTPQGAGVSISLVESSVEIQNGSSTTAELVQTASLQAKQKFTLEFLGRSRRQPQAQQNPSIELHWLKSNGKPAGPPTVLEIQPQDFDRIAGGDSVPDSTAQAEVHLVMPAGTSLTVSQLSVESLQTMTVPVSFIAQSPGELTISDLRVAYEKTAPPNPPVPAGGLASPTPPNQQPGQPASQCYCPCCGDDTTLVGSSPAKTLAGQPATVGKCVTCGTTLVRLGGLLVPGAPRLVLPTLSRAPKAGAGPGPRGPRRTVPTLQPPLTAIPGIGKTREQQLQKAGIYSVRELAAARPQVIAAALTGVSPANAPHFIAEARKLLDAGSWRPGVLRTIRVGEPQTGRDKPTEPKQQAMKGVFTMRTSDTRVRNRQAAFLLRHTDGKGQVRLDLWRIGVEHIRRMKIAAGVPRTAAPAPPGAPAPVKFVGVQWQQIGPAPLTIDSDQLFQGTTPVAGEVTDIAIDPSGDTDLIIYVATNDGGIWKSTDGGTTWAPKTESMPSLSMGAVALDPGNPSIVYAGTGNLFDGGGLFVQGGPLFPKAAAGIYRSIDGGETWSIVGASVFANIALNQFLGIKRIVLPAPNVLLVATTSGLFRSIDGGQNFGNDPAFSNGAPVLVGDISDLHLDTTQAGTVYAAVAGTGIMKSTDRGVTFPTNLFAGTGAPAAGSFGRVCFAQGTLKGGNPANQTFYASVSSQATSPNTYVGLFITANNGQKWAPIADGAKRAAENGNNAFFYTQSIGVDPQNADVLCISFAELWVSSNATSATPNFGNKSQSLTPVGQTQPFTSTSFTFGQAHFDHHAITFSPASHPPGAGAATPVYIGTDGGIGKSSDGGNTWQQISNGIATNLFKGIDIGRGSPANNVYSYGGCQDTGTVEHRPSFAANEWHLGIDGDGGRVAVDPTNPKKVFGCDDGAYIVSSDEGAHGPVPSYQSSLLLRPGS